MAIWQKYVNSKWVDVQFEHLNAGDVVKTLTSKRKPFKNDNMNKISVVRDKPIVINGKLMAGFNKYSGEVLP